MLFGMSDADDDMQQHASSILWIYQSHLRMQSPTAISSVTYSYHTVGVERERPNPETAMGIGGNVFHNLGVCPISSEPNIRLAGNVGALMHCRCPKNPIYGKSSDFWLHPRLAPAKQGANIAGLDYHSDKWRVRHCMPWQVDVRIASWERNAASRER